MRNRRREATALARWHVVQTAEEEGVSGAARRPHASLAEGTPAQHYRPSRTSAPQNLNSILAVEQPRGVGRDSTVAFRGKRLPLPPQYLGHRVWIQLLRDDPKITANNQMIAHYSVSNL